MGHEFIGVVEEVGSEVTTLRAGRLRHRARSPISCGTCDFCREGLQTSCVNGGFWNDANLGTAGGQAEAVRVPLADGTLVKVPGVDERPPTTAARLAADPVRRLRHRLARRRSAAACRRGTTVTVIGDGAVGLLAVLSAKQLGAERIVLMGRHQAAHRPRPRVRRHRRGRRTRRGGHRQVRDLTGGGSHARSSRPSATCPPTSRRSASSAPAA